eukprot:jgi/Tetstr1/449554/TSEL_036641.t1
MSSVPRRRKVDAPEPGASTGPSAQRSRMDEAGSSARRAGSHGRHSWTSRSTLLIWSGMLTVCIICAGLFTYQLGGALRQHMAGIKAGVTTAFQPAKAPPCRIHQKNIVPAQAECSIELYMQIMRQDIEDKLTARRIDAEGTTTDLDDDPDSQPSSGEHKRMTGAPSDERQQQRPPRPRRHGNATAAALQEKIIAARNKDLAAAGTASPTSSSRSTEYEARQRERELGLAWAEHMSIVISWVNGSDPEYRQLRMQYGGRQNVGTSRDRDNGELRHALRSIERYMPWHKGAIFLVTPGHHPSWLDMSHPRVRVVNQDTLLPEHATPTFSSNVVEQFLHKIPGLSDIFLYWNDDFFLGRPVAASDFVGVTGGGGRYAKLFLSSSPIGKGGPAAAEAARNARKSWLSMLYTTNGVLNAAYGEDKKRSHLLHAPYVFYKAAFSAIHAKWGKELNETANHRFRRWDDMLMPYLHHYYIIHDGSKCCGFKYERVGVSSRTKRYYQFHILTNNFTANSEAL